MQPQEAIRELSRLKTGRPTNDYDRQDKAIEMAKAAISKAFIAKKPLPIKANTMRSTTTGLCPNCNAEMICDWLYWKRKKEGGAAVGYCHVCGQAIDWSEKI